MSLLTKLFFIIGIVCLGLYGLFSVQARMEQSALERELYMPRAKDSAAAPATARRLKEGDLFGRLEIPRLNVSVMVMEGIGARTLRLGAGHIPGTALGIAAHRDSFFRPLKDIRVNDTIRFTTPEKSADYRVVATKIVRPKDVSVLDPEPPNTMTLVTCYPFFYIGPAPKRFIVQAVKN